MYIPSQLYRTKKIMLIVLLSFKNCVYYCTNPKQTGDRSFLESYVITRTVHVT